MKLRIAELREGENPFQMESGKEPWLRDLISRVEKEGFSFSAPMNVDIRLTKLEPDYYLRGSMGFALKQPCARCAETFELPIKHQFELALNHVPGLTKEVFQASEESEELDITFFHGNEIDLDPVLEEQFFLSVPLKSVCRDNCKGICQKCGKNLNQGACGCKESDPAHPFSILETLKK